MAPYYYGVKRAKGFMNWIRWPALGLVTSIWEELAPKMDYPRSLMPTEHQRQKDKKEGHLLQDTNLYIFRTSLNG